MNGIVVLNKPCGITSHSACKKVGRLLGEKKCGQLGTLDPDASGVLPISLGKATKLFDYFLQKGKTYVAEFTFGYETDTLDAQGKIIQTSNTIPNEVQVKKVLSSMIGMQLQMPPKYSAKSINGVRAYDLARNNVEFELNPKEIEIYKLELIREISATTFEILVECSSGTYIRSICRDIAYKLKTFATMTKLVRTLCGKFDIKDAYTFEDIEKFGDKTLLPIAKVLEELPIIEADSELAFRLKNGQTVVMDGTKIEGDVLVVENGKELGLANIANNKIKIKIHF